MRIGLCARYNATDVDPELTEAVRTAAGMLAECTSGELVEVESPWTEKELEESKKYVSDVKTTFKLKSEAFEGNQKVRSDELK